jgi:hypothetical protein
MEDPILEYGILEAVHETDGRLTQRHVSQRVGRSVSSVNFALRLLAAKGFIKISGINPHSLRYHLTPKGVLQKSLLAYNFLKRQSALYKEARNGLLEKLKTLGKEGVRRVSVYGWTPLTETAILYLITDGIRVSAIYVERPVEFAQCNRIPVRLIDEFEPDCEILLLMEDLPTGLEEKIVVRKMICFPVA